MNLSRFFSIKSQDRKLYRSNFAGEAHIVDMKFSFIIRNRQILTYEVDTD